MRNSDARVQILRHKVDVVMSTLLEMDLDDAIDTMDHYLLATLRQQYLDIAVFNKVTYYVNNVIRDHCLILEW